MKVLDCESLDSIFSSLESILGLEHDRIYEFIFNFDFESCSNNHLVGQKTEDQILLLEIKKIIREPIKIHRTMWFHLTRCNRKDSFSNGILPLNKVIDKIWSDLFLAAKKYVSIEEWNEFRNVSICNMNNNLAYDYNEKINSPYHYGPYGLLIRDNAFNAKSIGNHDYLSVPEIVEDICYCFEEFSGKSIMDDYRKMTSPMLVKFYNAGGEEDYIGVVLYYLYLKLREKELPMGYSPCFDNKGKQIDFKNIEKVEMIKSSKYDKRKTIT